MDVTFFEIFFPPSFLLIVFCLSAVSVKSSIPTHIPFSYLFCSFLSSSSFSSLCLSFSPSRFLSSSFSLASFGTSFSFFSSSSATSTFPFLAKKSGSKDRPPPYVGDADTLALERELLDKYDDGYRRRNVWRKKEEGVGRQKWWPCPYVIDAEEFHGVDPFGDGKPHEPLKRRGSIETAVDEWRRNEKNENDEKNGDKFSSNSFLNSSSVIPSSMEEATGFVNEKSVEEELAILQDEKTSPPPLRNPAAELMRRMKNDGSSFAASYRRRSRRHFVEGKGYVAEAEDTATWDVMDGHELPSIPMVDGEVVFDEYQPGHAYWIEKGWYNNTVVENPYNNGNISSDLPSYLNPVNPLMRTGRRRDIQRRRDAGMKQRRRWRSEEMLENGKDIPRGNWSRPDDRFKELVYSVDWERQYPVYYDQNYYKRTNIERGFTEDSNARDSYFDVQFIGSPDTYPASAAVGVNFTWTLNWIPWLCKKYPRKYGQPLKSLPFNMGGVEPLQVWFWPDGTPHSLPGYCAMKLVSRPGWRLPFPIFMSLRSEYGEIKTGPIWRNTKDYVVYSLSFCRLLAKDERPLPSPFFEKSESLILGPAGNVYLTIGVADEKWDWDDGAWDFEQWLKRETADQTLPEETLPDWFTHSEWYENFKYKDIPDKHFSKYIPSNVSPREAESKPQNLKDWTRHPF